MKKKFIILALCFTLFFSSINFKRSYADGGVISLPMVATVSALAVGTGIIINNSDDLYDIGRLFYDYIDKHNTLTWQTVQSVFSAGVSLQPNKLVSVDSKFLDIVNDFFDNVFSSDDDKIIKGYHIYPNFVDVSDHNYGPFKISGGKIFVYGNGSYSQVKILGDNDVAISFKPHSTSSNYYIYTKRSNGSVVHSVFQTNGHVLFDGGIVSFPYSGGYDWNIVKDKVNDDKLSIPIPGNLGTLVGQTSSDFWGNADNLVGDSGLSIPSVSNPSIGVDNSVTTFPSVSVDSPGTDIPNDGIWATIKDFIISLVVPSDTYWTDTWGGLYDNFTNSFPMVNMDGFNDLVTGEKKFPNMDVDVMGVTGRVVNGDVINSIVDWLRPIIAGFIMLCLMLFNYRKIYKLIRNSEPFGGIAQGTSDFKTGISEYQNYDDYKQSLREYRDFLYNQRGK